MFKLNLKKPKFSLNLPLQILETYNPFELDKTTLGYKNKSSTKTVEIKGVQYLDLFHFFDEQENDVLDEENWYNLLIWGDNLYVINSLKDRFTKKIKLIYIDPPFYTGTDEVIDIPIGLGNKTIKQGPSPIQDIAYKNIWDQSNPAYSFSHWFYHRIIGMHNLLRDDGFIVVRYDYHFGHYAKILLDHVFGNQNYVGEFLVRRMTKTVTEKYLQTQRHLIHQNDSLFIYKKSEKATFELDLIKKSRANQDELELIPNNNVWLDIVGYEKTKRTLYPTENSRGLLRRVITTFSNKGDIVADFFCGSGTTISVASQEDRSWIGVDLSRYSINEIKKRLLNQKKKIPFQLLNLEMYNKHLLYLKKKDEEINQHISEALNEYYQMIIEYYGGEYQNDNEHIHGTKDDWYIHVGNIDTMVSSIEIKSAMEEVKKLNGEKLIILGWDFMMEATFFKKLIQKEEKIEVELKKIPDTILFNRNDDDHSFINLPFINLFQEIDPLKRTINLKISDVQITSDKKFVDELSNENIEKIDLLDFWAVDWDYDSIELFRPHETSFRKIGSGRKIVERVKENMECKYEKPGKYMIVINFVDILGHDTTEYIDIEFS